MPDRPDITEEVALAAMDEARARVHDVMELNQEALALLAAERSRTAALVEAGTELALWLQDWIDAHPGTTWCYSETALSAWRALLPAAQVARDGEAGDE